MGKDNIQMAHYFSPTPETPSERQMIEARIHGIDFRFVSDTQVFSRRHVDFGTRLMIDTVISDLSARELRRGRLLDLGCGYGVVGIVMKRVFPAMDVILADVNERAVELSKENAKSNQCTFLNISESDGFESIEGDFQVVLTNPPVRAGKATVFSFYAGASEHLVPGGVLYVVLQKKQGALSSLNRLTELFGNCEVIEKDSGYWVMRSVTASVEHGGES